MLREIRSSFVSNVCCVHKSTQQKAIKSTLIQILVINVKTFKANKCDLGKHVQKHQNLFLHSRLRQSGVATAVGLMHQQREPTSAVSGRVGTVTPASQIQQVRLSARTDDVETVIFRTFLHENKRMNEHLAALLLARTN